MTLTATSLTVQGVVCRKAGGMSELTIKDKVDPRKLPTKLLVDTYKETGSYRQAAKKLGVSVQFLYQRIKKHGSKDITTKEFINYHAMTREEIESFIESAITEAYKKGYVDAGIERIKNE